MRQTLTALASYNETERGVLLRQFEWQEQAAIEQAHQCHPPYQLTPGLLGPGQFVAAWHNFALKVTAAQCKALFVKYGATMDGLLSYHAFAQRLLSTSARALGTGAAGAPALSCRTGKLADTAGRPPWGVGCAFVYRRCVHAQGYRCNSDAEQACRLLNFASCVTRCRYHW